MVFPLSTHGVNIGEAERAASVFLGGALWLTAFKRRSPATVLGAVVGTICLMRGVTGHSRIYQWFGLDSAHDTTPKTDGERAPDAPLARPSKPRNPGDPTQVSSFITINADAKRLYDLWLEPQTMNQILGHVAHIETQNDGAMHWRADLPLNSSLEWTTQTTDKKAGEFIAWEAAPDAPLQSSGPRRVQKCARRSRHRGSFARALSAAVWERWAKRRRSSWKSCLRRRRARRFATSRRWSKPAKFPRSKATFRRAAPAIHFRFDLFVGTWPAMSGASKFPCAHTFAYERTWQAMSLLENVSLRLPFGRKTDFCKKSVSPNNQTSCEL